MSRLNRIGRYHVDEVWMEDARGRIVRARDTRLEAAVLIRELFLPTDPVERGRRLQACRTASQALAHVSHPCIERPCDLGESEDSAYLVFQRPDPAEFRPLPEVQRSLGVEELTRVAGEAAGALAVLAAASALPARFRPDFLLRSPAGVVRLLPLEILEPVAEAEPSAHAAPAGGVLEGAAAYSLAAWLYLALAPGAPPPREAAAQGLPPEPLWTLNPSVRAAVDDALQRALHPDALRRTGGLAELAQALAARTSAPVVLPTPRAPVTTPLDTEPKAPAWTLYAAMAVAGSATGWWLAQLFPAR